MTPPVYRGQSPDDLPPQLTSADLARLTPDQVVTADDLGQLETVKSGRDPLPFERSGERRATEAEDAQARIDQAEADRAAAAAITKEIDA
jgi:hypothetical protein